MPLWSTVHFRAIFCRNLACLQRPGSLHLPPEHGAHARIGRLFILHGRRLRSGGGASAERALSGAT